MNPPPDSDIVSIHLCSAHGFWHAFIGWQGDYHPVSLEFDEYGFDDVYDMVDVRIKLAEDILHEIIHSQGTIPFGSEHEV